MEFRPGAGLWTIVSFAGEAARERWQEPVKAAFRLLADSGFGGERSRGWGRSETPEFVEGLLPDMILAGEAGGQGPGAGETPVPAPTVQPILAEPPAEESVEAAPDTVAEAPAPDPQPRPEPAPEEAPAPKASEAAHWLLSLFTPGAADAVDWGRGNYTVLARGGRVESPAGSGELKKQLQMVAEGSVLVAASASARGGARCGARWIRPSRVPRRIRAVHPAAGGGLMRYRAHVANSFAGRGRPQAQPHRLHGLERPRQRARPVAHLPAAGQGAASGRVPRAAEEGRQAGFRLLGRVCAEFRGAAHAVREPGLFRLLEPRFGRKPAHPHVFRGALRAVSARRRH